MAGIAGIWIKSPIDINGKSVVSMMLRELGPSRAEFQVYSEGSVFFGIKGMSHSQGCKAYATKDGRVRCVVDGTVFSGGGLNAESDLPEFYLQHGRDIVKRLTGWYNVFLHDKERKCCLLFNSRFGMLPLFVYENDDLFIFCSKITGLAVSKAFEVEWDKVCQLEHTIFNYPLSEHTFLKRVQTLSPATLYTLFTDQSICKAEKYWQFDRLLGIPTLPQKESIELIDATMDQVVRKVTASPIPYGLSLTGGWDGRLVLAYFLKNTTEHFTLYSFGAEDSTDISIPALISGQLKLPYRPFILDDEYVVSHFPSSARDTIWKSSGYRNYLRSHYLYTMRRLSDETECVLSGNCGSNVLKFSEIVPGAVLSAPLIELIQTSFLPDCIVKEIDKYRSILTLSENDIDEFHHRVTAVGNEASRFGKDLSRIYFYILLMKVERKFFGFELSSYNDYVYNYSPFIDFEFIDALSRTILWGANHPFNSHSHKLKVQSFDLYKSLIMANYPKLCAFKTDRGATFHQLNRVDGKIFLYIKRNFSKLLASQSKDPFNTSNLHVRFLKTTNLPDNQFDGLTRNEAANIKSTLLFRQELLGRLNV